MGVLYRLAVEKVLGADCFTGTGKPTGVYWHPDGGAFAVASTFRWSGWAGHAFTKRLRCTHRVAVYEAATCKRLSVFDALDWPVNEVAFHPHTSLVAIATGEYDGGWCYEGDLLLGDYSTGGCHSVLRESREVTRCRFHADGGFLYWLARPPVEEDEDGNNLSNTYFGFRSQGVDGPFECLEMADTGFTTAYARRSTPDVVAELQRLATGAGKSYEPRWHTWDVVWIGDQELISVGQNPLLEHWDCGGRRLRMVGGDDRPGVQAFWDPTQERVLVNRFALGLHGSVFPSTSSLLVYSPQTSVLSTVVSEHPAFCLSMIASAQLLARDCSSATSGSTRDFLIGADFVPNAPIDLGRYDLYNHYLRIDGGDKFYFLQGNPPTSHERQWLCCLDPYTGEMQRMFPLEWDRVRGAHFHPDAGCLVSDSMGPSVILGMHQYHPHVFPADGAIICRRDLPNGMVRWMRDFDSQVTALADLSSDGLVAFALTEGKMGLLDATTGALVDISDAKVDGVGTMIMCLATRGGRLAAGTIDGVVLILETSKPRV